jgi:hypothetical protein
MKSTEDNNMMAEPTLTELVDNNVFILENRISEETISHFIQVIVESEKHEKYVKLLRALVNCEGTASVDNQENITKLILEDPENRENLLMPLRVTKG